MKTDILGAGQFVEFILTREGMKREDDVNCENTKQFKRSDTIVVAVIAIYAIAKQKTKNLSVLFECNFNNFNLQ